MKDFSLRIVTPWCISLISLLFIAGCGSSNNPISPNAASLSTVNSVNSTVPNNVYSATLTGTNEVPANMSTASATGVVVVDTSTSVMKATIVTADITGSAAHIHLGVTGVAGPVLFPLTESSPGSGIWTATATLTTDQLAQLSSNRFYFNVHSAAFPDGEIRGQILARLPQSGVPVSTSSSDTLATNTNPTITTTETATNSSASPSSGTSTTTSSGTGTGTSNTVGTTSGLLIGSSVSGTSSTGSTGSTGTTGSGSTVNTTPTSTSGIVTNTAASTDTNNNIGTTSTVTQATNRPVFFVNLLTGSLVIPPNASSATATAISVYRPSDKSLTSVIISSGMTGTGANLRQAAASANGSLVASLTEITAGSGIWHTRSTLSDSQVSSLNGNNLYYEVLSAVYPNGEVRGQIIKTQGTRKIATTTSSTNIGTSSTTASTGTAGTTGSAVTTTPTTLTPSTVSTISPTATTTTTTSGTQSALSGMTGSTIGSGTTASTGSSALNNTTTGMTAGTTTPVTSSTTPVTAGTSTNTGSSTTLPITATSIFTQ